MIENPDDTKKCVIAQRYHYSLDGSELRDQITIVDKFTYVAPYTGKPVSPLDGAYIDLQDDCKENGPSTAVFIDSWQACSSGDDFNDNVGMLLTQQCRTFTKLPGNPPVIVLVHPVKNAGEDNLVPYGGGAALNEIATSRFGRMRERALRNFIGFASFAVHRSSRSSSRSDKFSAPIWWTAKGDNSRSLSSNRRAPTSGRTVSKCNGDGRVICL